MHLSSKCLLLIVILLQIGVFQCASWIRKRKGRQVFVETRSGKLLGWNDGDVSSFLGIPYAEPPVGQLRFRPPIPKQPWYPSTYSALTFSPECLQSDLYIANDDILRDEDCLYLNVWIPARSKVLLPVMVWFYGGAFIHGGSSKPEYNGRQLASKGMIVVTFNYRLGALGFLVSTADGLYGNYGLADQKAVLQWIQDNIEAFGGDPARVTLFGESAGAMSIGLHMLEQELRAQDRAMQSPPQPPAPPLFHHVIMQSNPFGYKYRSISVANFIGAAFKEQVDCDDLLCLQRESADELIHVQDSLMAVPRSIGDFFTWGPVLTDASFFRELRLRPVARADVANVSVFQPMLALPTLQRLQIPVLMGNNAHEGTLFVFTAYPARMTKLVFSALVLSMFRTSALAVLRIYDSLIRVVDDQRNPDYRLVLSQILGDYLFACPNHKVAVSLARLRGGDRPSNESQTTTAATSSRYSNRLHQKVSRSPKVFLYDFRLPTRTPGFAFCTGLSCHTSELPYVFDQQDIVANYYSYPALAMGRETRLDAHEQQVLEAHGEVARRMSDHWVTFARFGDVNGQQQQSGDYSYIPGTGVRGVGQWPEVLGQALPSDRPVCALARAPSAAMSAAGDALEGSTSSKLVSTPLDAALSEIEVEDHEEEAFEEAVRINKLVLLHSQLLDNEMGDEDLSSLSAMDRSVRRMVFAESSHVVEEDRDRDCLCLFWDKLAYRF